MLISEGELRYASDPLPHFQRLERAKGYQTPRLVSHLTPSRRILYAGEDIYLPARLTAGLKSLDCFVVRSPASIARTFLRSDIEYSLLLFDDTPEGAALRQFARTLPHRERTPFVLIKQSERLGGLLDTIRRRLGTTRVA
jgi:hypothetical protein